MKNYREKAYFKTLTPKFGYVSYLNFNVNVLKYAMDHGSSQNGTKLVVCDVQQEKGYYVRTFNVLGS